MFRPPSRSVPLATSFEGYYQATRTLYRTFFASPIIYILAGWAIKNFAMSPQGGFVDFPPAEYNVILAIAGLTSLALIAAAHFLLPRLRPVSALVRQSATVLDLGNALLRAQMLRMQMVQAPAIFGLVLFLLNGILLHLVLFTVLTLLAQVLERVEPSTWEAARNEFETSRPAAGRPTDVK